jgi:hypothetical protein
MVLVGLWVLGASHHTGKIGRSLRANDRQPLVPRRLLRESHTSPILLRRSLVTLGGAAIRPRDAVDLAQCRRRRGD